MTGRIPDVARAALITGSAAPIGIGASVARRLVARGYGLVLVDLDPSVTATAGELASELGLPAETIHPWVGDATDEASLEAAVAEAVRRFGRLDVAFANAGGGGTEVDLIDLETSEFDRIVTLNLRSTFLTCKAAGRVMREARRGSIVTVASIFALEPALRTAPYAAAKAAIIALTQAAAKELAPYGVRVNSVVPGHIATTALVRTEEARAARAGLTFDEERQRVDRLIPLGRHGSPDDVAATVEFLASDDAAYITGQTLGVTGGIVMR